ncbi:lipase maturation factor 1-like, partial [Lepus europaeus]|uniref:lipase maturation factor 1-like n=1 Tax=Lepus europaeus TaxID=9983 RepID=UPI002B49BCCA
MDMSCRGSPPDLLLLLSLTAWPCFGVSSAWYVLCSLEDVAGPPARGRRALKPPGPGPEVRGDLQAAPGCCSGLASGQGPGSDLSGRCAAPVHLAPIRLVFVVLGWESQLLETGFLGIFLCPLWTLARLPRCTPTSRIVLWGFRWLIFRIMLGAGLIKIRGDRCWRDLTCMDFHYETQPVPNPLAYYLHRSPWWFHRFETLGNHFVELLVPFLVFLGRRLCVLHGALQILFQVVLILSGNLSFLNWLTIVPSLACFDDATLGPLFPSGPGGLKRQVLQLQRKEPPGAQPGPTY